MIEKIKAFFVMLWATVEKFIATTLNRIHEIYDGILAMIKSVVSDHKILLWTILGILIVADLALGARFGVIANLLLAIKGILEVVALNLGAAVIVIIGIGVWISSRK